jgi:hypothetical protein
MSATSRRCRAYFLIIPRLSVRNAGTERELVMMRWGMPPPRLT